MDLVLAICQAIGLAVAVGVGGPLAALFISAMAYLHLGIDTRGTSWKFLGAGWFLVVVLLANIVSFYAASRDEVRRVPQVAFATVFGAIAGGASLAEQGESAVIGVLIGALVGLGTALIASDILVGAQRRARNSSLKGAGGETSTLELIFAAAGIVIAVLALFVPPLSLLALVALAILARGRRKRAGEKYEGLRVLR